MQEKLLVKAGAIQNLTDARYFASKGVEWIGFDFSPESSRFILPREAQQIMGWLHGLKTVGEFSGRPFNEVRETAMILNLDYVQLPHSELGEGFNEIEQAIIAEVVMESGVNYKTLKTLLEKEKDNAEFFQLSVKEKFNVWKLVEPYMQISIEQLKTLCENYPIIFNIELDNKGLLQMIENVAPAAINILGSDEIKTGTKSFDELEKLFELIQFEL